MSSLVLSLTMNLPPCFELSYVIYKHGKKFYTTIIGLLHKNRKYVMSILEVFFLQTLAINNLLTCKCQSHSNPMTAKPITYRLLPLPDIALSLAVMALQRP